MPTLYCVIETEPEAHTVIAIFDNKVQAESTANHLNHTFHIGVWFEVEEHELNAIDARYAERLTTSPPAASS